MRFKRLMAGALVASAVATAKANEVIGLWTFSGEDGTEIPANAEFENQAGGELSLVLRNQRAGTWTKIKPSHYLADTPAPYVFSDTALTNSLGSLVSSVRLEGDVTTGGDTWMFGSSLVLTNFGAQVGAGSWTVEVIARVTKTQSGGVFFGCGNASSKNEYPAVCFLPFEVTDGRVQGYEGTTAKFTENITNMKPNRISRAGLRAGSWRHVVLSYNADSNKYIFRSDYSDFDYELSATTSGDIGNESEFRIGGVWNGSYGAYPTGVDVAAVRVTRGVVPWYGGMAPWVTTQPKELVHYRFSGGKGEVVASVRNEVTPNLDYTMCTAWRFDDSAWQFVQSQNTVYSDDVVSPYVAQGGGRSRLENASAVSSCAKGVDDWLAFYMQNLPAYFVGDFTIEMIMRVETPNHDEALYPNPSVSLFSAPTFRVPIEVNGFSIRSSQYTLRIEVWDGSRFVEPLKTPWGAYEFSRSVWHRVALVCDREAGQMKLYYDGELVTKLDGAAGGSFDPALPIWKAGAAMSYACIGGLSGPQTSDFKGVVDEFRITRGALEPKDFLTPKNRPTTGLIMSVR